MMQRNHTQNLLINFYFTDAFEPLLFANAILPWAIRSDMFQTEFAARSPCSIVDETCTFAFLESAVDFADSR